MNCNRSEELLALHAGGDLSLTEAAEVEAHVEDCPQCAAELQAFRDSRKALLELRSHERTGLLADPGESLWKEIDARLAAADAVNRLRRPWYRRTGWISSLAAAAVLTFSLPFAFDGLSGSHGDDLNDSGASLADGPGTRGSLDAEDPGLIPASDEDLLKLFMPMPGGSPATLPAGLENGALDTAPASHQNPVVQRNF